MGNLSPRSVLIVADAFILGGMETRLVDELQEFLRRGYCVYLATDISKFDPEILREHPRVSIARLNFSRGFNIQSLIANIDALRALIGNNRIDLICSNGFHSSFASAIAAQIEGISFVVTMHGPGAILGANPVARLILEKVIFPRADRINCVSREVCAAARSIAERANVVVVPNLVNTDIFSPCALESRSEKKWVIISRLSDEKVLGIISFIEAAFLAGIPGVVIFGDGPLKESIQNTLELAGIAHYVEFGGSSYSVQKILKEFSGVAGVGRVVLEAISSQVPACVLGYNGGIKGLVDVNNFYRFQYANFSGRNMPTISLDDFRASLSSIENANLQNLRELVERELSTVQLRHVVDDYEILKNRNNLAALEQLYVSACYFEGEISASYVLSRSFIFNVLLPAVSTSTDGAKDNMERGELLYKQVVSFFKTNAESPRLALRVVVNDGSVIASVDNKSIMSDECIRLDAPSYVRTRGTHRIRCKYSIIDAGQSLARPPAILSVRFESSDEHEAVMDVPGLSKSPIREVGYFRYLDASRSVGEQEFEFVVPRGAVVKEAIIRPWKPNRDATLGLQYLQLIAFNI